MTEKFKIGEYALVGVCAALNQEMEILERFREALEKADNVQTCSKTRILTQNSSNIGLSAAEMTFSLQTEDQYMSLKAECAEFEGDWALLPEKTRKKQLLICDMDSTIIAEECLDELAAYAGIKDEIAAITARAMAGEIEFKAALIERVDKLKGLPIDVIEACYQTRINLNPGAKTLVQTMKTKGALCLLVSGGFTAFTAKVAAAAGFHANYANTLIDDGAHLSGTVAEPILDRESKRDRLLLSCAQKGMSPEESLAIGDGANDLDMIQAAGLGIAYKAKPIVASEADAQITQTDLRAALFFQGYHADEFAV